MDHMEYEKDYGHNSRVTITTKDLGTIPTPSPLFRLDLQARSSYKFENIERTVRKNIHALISTHIIMHI